MPPRTTISGADAALQGFGAAWARPFLYVTAIWAGIALGAGSFIAGNPLGWFVYQVRSFEYPWGIPLLIVHAVMFYQWVYQDPAPFRMLAAIAGLHALQAFVVERAEQHWSDTPHLLSAHLLIYLLGLGALAFWLVQRGFGKQHLCRVLPTLARLFRDRDRCENDPPAEDPPAEKQGNPDETG